MIYERQNKMLKFLFKTLGVMIVIGGIFSIVWLRSSIKSLEYRLGNLQIKEQQLIKEQRNLLVKKEGMLSLKKIEHVAMNKMGFGFPDRTKVFTVKGRRVPKPFLASFKRGM